MATILGHMLTFSDGSRLALTHWPRREVVGEGGLWKVVSGTAIVTATSLAR